MNKYIAIALAIVLVITGIVLLWKTPPCGGDYEFAFGGEKYFFFKCIQAPKPSRPKNPTGYLGNFSVTRDYAIKGKNNIRIQTGISEEDCAKLCSEISLPNFECRSFDYIKPESYCDLSSVNRFEPGVRFYRNTKVDHYSRN